MAELNRPLSVKTLGERQRAVLERITVVLTSDERVAGAWLAGSFGRYEEDGWCDFDLHVAIDDVRYKAFLLDRLKLYAAIDTPILVQPEFTQGPDLEGGCFQLVYFPGPIEVDWSFGPASKALKPIGHKLLFERQPFAVISTPALTAEQRSERLQWWTTFFWAMAPIAVKYVARGETRSAAAQTDLLNRALICLHRLLTEEPGPDPWRTATNRPLEDWIDARLPRTGSVITPHAALRTIREQCDEMLTLHGALTARGIDVHPLMPAELEQQIHLAESVLETGVFSRRRYR